MKLDDILHGDAAMIFMERYVDEAAQSYSPFAQRSETAPDYRPRTGRASFEVVTVRAPRDRVSVFEADPVPALRQRYIGNGHVLFAVHPETWSSADTDGLAVLHALPRGEPIEVAPTASTRTVFTKGHTPKVPAHFLKLHYPCRISRFNRRLRWKNIRNSVGVSRDLEHVGLDRFAYLPESLGATFGDSPEPWGFLVREATPRPHQGQNYLIPYFALYAGDLRHPEDPPLLVQLIERLGAEPVSFVIDEIITPVLECWAKVVRERGILLESHGQNLLLEVDGEFRPRRVVHRDFDVWCDADTREQAGLGALGVRIGIDTHYPRKQHYSLIYDHFLGRELFDYLLKLLTRYYSADERSIRGCVAQSFHGCFPDSRDFFPADTTYYFSDEILPGNEYRLVDTRRAPEWR